MERFVIIVNDWKPLTIITKRSILDIAAALDPPLSAQKVKFSIKDLFSKFDQISSFLRTWSYLLKKSLLENFISVLCTDPHMWAY